MGGQCFSLSLIDFALNCSFYDQNFISSLAYQWSIIDIGNENPTIYWREISTLDLNPYDPRITKSSGIGNPALRYLHRLIALTIYGRQESIRVVANRDLFYLRCFHKGLVPHIGYGGDG